MLGILYGWRKRNEGELFEERSVRAALEELPQGTASVGCGLSPHWRCCTRRRENQVRNKGVSQFALIPCKCLRESSDLINLLVAQQRVPLIFIDKFSTR
jgi:hypothetical protein